MPDAARNKPLKLLPVIAAAARARAAQINLPLSTYISLVLWNYCQAPAWKIKAEPDSPRLNREHVPCTIRHTTWMLLAPLVKRSKLSANALIEAIIAQELRATGAGLTILPARGLAKVRL